MKKNTNTYVLFALLIGVGFLMYRYNHQPNAPLSGDDQTASVADSQNINTETIFYGENGEVLSYPRTTSFSNAESNTNISATPESEPAVTLVQKIFSKRSPVITQPKKETPQEPKKSFFGVFYTDVLNKYGTDACNVRAISADDKNKVKNIKYTKDNFTLTQTIIEGEDAYLFVDADEIPDGTCGKAVIFASKNPSKIKNIYVLVNEK